MKKYPSGGNYPETKEDYAEHFTRILETATPEQLNRLTQKSLERGGKFALLARHLIGEFDLDELNKRLDALENDAQPG